ncbi:uncharacterized protein EI90DRAFT_3048130 [Cantharellus anzutake]|uniref:uncharacterized protein n=1 Tax=Cantharellus anzutake TaxID=1750568 RepID=UPI0019089BF9|nr:uncharacterized protein EI90DRAFT_3048130 [Cantharellus anzutake]KAF8335384.1 hypothetical protein EI90DRAFT_3048130 [Cantharellus anzutake]
MELLSQNHSIRSIYASDLSRPLQDYADAFNQWFNRSSVRKDWDTVPASDLVSGGAPSMSQHYLDRFYLRIGSWQHEKWKISLAVSLAHPDPLVSVRPWHDRELFIFIERSFDERVRPDVGISASFRLALDEHEMNPETRIFKGCIEDFSCTFTRANSVHVVKGQLLRWTHNLWGLVDSGASTARILIQIETSEMTVTSKRSSSRFLKNDDIRLHVCSFLDAVSIAAMDAALAPPKTRADYDSDSVNVLLRRVFSSFGKYFSDPCAFADCLHQSGALVGGSTVLCILNSESWEPGDLDVIVSRYMPAPIDTFDYERYKKGELQIDVSISLWCSPAQFIVSDYHHSFVMNFISSEGIYCLFPETFSRRGWVNGPLRRRVHLVRAKYIARGYEILPGSIQDQTGPVDILRLRGIWSVKLPLTSAKNERTAARYQPPVQGIAVAQPFISECIVLMFWCILLAVSGKYLNFNEIHLVLWSSNFGDR